MFDTVKVDNSTFREVLFMSSQVRDEWNEDRNAPKAQKRNAQGVPLWHVQCAVTNWRGKSDMLKVTVPAASDPGDELTAGQSVSFEGLMFGVSPKRNGGFSLWWTAEAVQPVAATAGKRNLNAV